MADESKELLQWQAGWKRAQSIAMYTLSGLPMDANPEHHDAMFRAYQAAVQLWERLCCREQRAESEVKAAARQIGLMLDKDNKISEKRLGLIQFNKFNTLNGKRLLDTELGWIVDIYLRGPNAIVRPHPSIKAFDLELWRPWEIIYITGLRAIDAAVQAINAGDTELGLCLTFDALNEMYLCDDFATGNERNKEYAGCVDTVFDRNRGAVTPKETILEKIRKRITPRSRTTKNAGGSSWTGKGLTSKPGAYSRTWIRLSSTLRVTTCQPKQSLSVSKSPWMRP